jgi:hypothetical protein
MQKIKKAARIIIPWVIILGVGAFFYATLAENWDKVQGFTLQFSPLTVVGMLFFILAVVVSGVLWGKLLSRLAETPIRVADAVKIHSASWLLKYIPGQVGSYVNKIAWGMKQGISKKTISTSFIYENTLMIFAGFALSLPVFLLFREQIGTELAIILPLLVLIPLSLVLVRPVFYGLLNFVFTKLKRKPFKPTDFLSTKHLLQYQAGYLLPRLANGIGFVFIVATMVSLTPDMYVGVAATYILASIIGLLALFVPGGLGVREAVIVLCLSVYLPIEQAIIISLVTRLYATIADIGVALIYLVLNKGKLSQS